MRSNELKVAFSLTFPTVIAYFTLSMIFGVLFTHAGFSWYLAPAMSAVVYAGAVQFVALGMMTDHAGLFSILVPTLFVALRNSFYGLSVTERFKPAPFLTRCFLIFGLVDATYAILTLKPKQKNDIKFCFFVTLFPYLSWFFGSFFGAFFADIIPEIKGMDFILTSFFMVLTIEYYLLNKKIDALLIPIVVSFMAYWLLPQYYLLIAIVACALYLYIKLKATS